jgi:type IV secretory pathway protease TraF
LVWLIDGAKRPAPAANLVCAHCGNPLSLESRQDSDVGGESVGTSGISFDTVTIETRDEIDSSGDALSRGDVVAVRWQGRIHVKRLAAAPGDEISLRGNRLLVNRVRIEDTLCSRQLSFPIPWMLVDDDKRRESSRWSAHDASDERADWTRDQDGRWDSFFSSGSSTWLVYRHRSSSRGNLSSPVWDDFPYNVSLSRKLFPVDRLRLRGTAESDVRLTVAFWSEAGNVAAERTLIRGEAFCVSYFDGATSEGLAVTARQPVAIRIEGAATLRDLKIERLVEYRLNPAHDLAVYPLHLGADEWFLVGDNVPVSIDSRDWGTIPEDQILGRVISSEPPQRRAVFPLMPP